MYNTHTAWKGGKFVSFDVSVPTNCFCYESCTPAIGHRAALSVIYKCPSPSPSLRSRRRPPSNINLLDAGARAGHAHVYVHVDRESRNSKRSDFESGDCPLRRFPFIRSSVEKEAARHTGMIMRRKQTQKVWKYSVLQQGKEIPCLSCLR